VAVTVDVWPGRVFPARVVALDSQVDAQSRMATVRAELDNHDRALLPGIFAVAHLPVGPARPVLTIPAGAVSYSPYGNFVFVLTPQMDAPGRFVATSRVVRLESAQGSRVPVAAGLQEGERIVIAGGFKLRNGAIVTVDNRAAPPDTLDPTVAEE
jgi:membrane fusion protein (multidrug efflux system)